MAAAMDKVMKQKADIDAPNAEMSKTSHMILTKKVSLSTVKMITENNYSSMIGFMITAMITECGKEEVNNVDK